MAGEITDQRERAILQAMETTTNFQARAWTEAIDRMNTLATRLEPLVPLQEHMLAMQDEKINRLEVLVLALTKVIQELRALYQEEHEELQEQQEHPQGVL